MEPLSFNTVKELEQKATLGLIVLKEDETIEGDFRHIMPIDVALHVSRVESGERVSLETLSAMKERLVAAASLFPTASRFDCVGYACTSGAAVIGDAAISEQINAGCSAHTVTSPVAALIDACDHLNIGRLALLSPYVADVSTALRNRLELAGIATPTFRSFDEENEANVVRIDENSIVEAAMILDRDADVDALFISCTNLRTLNAISQIEDAIHKPVLTSNQVLAWHMAQCAKISINQPGFGRLLL